MACVLGAAVAIGYVIYAAPLLLAEVALDAAVVSTSIAGSDKDDVSHWAVTVLKRTWMSALALVIFAAIARLRLCSRYRAGCAIDRRCACRELRRPDVSP